MHASMEVAAAASQARRWQQQQGVGRCGVLHGQHCGHDLPPKGLPCAEKAGELNPRPVL
jgi:hypothetical protein